MKNIKEAGSAEKQARGNAPSAKGVFVRDFRSAQGSFTIEAVLVMSVIIASLTASLICAFYLHDRAVLRSRVCETAAMGGVQACFADSLPFSAAEAASNVQNLMIRAGSSSVVYERSEDRIFACGSGEFVFPSYTADLIGEGTRSLNETWERTLYHPADLIRQVRAWKRVMDKAEP